MSGSLVARELPFKLPEVHVDMLWHERDAKSPSHKWLREHLTTVVTDDGFERNQMRQVELAQR